MQEGYFAEVVARRVTSVPPAAHLMARYAGRVPRYTTYPITARFVEQIDDSAHRLWLKNVAPGRPVCVYVHLPFSDQPVSHKSGTTIALTARALIEEYVATLTREIDLVAEALPGRLDVSAVHFGGGTATMLAIAGFAKIMDALRRRFDILRMAEIAAELDPSTLTPSWVEAAQALGLNRASLGVQDFDPIVLQAINRNQSFERVAACFGWLRDAGVTSINLELNYGLPHQNVGRLLTTAAQAASLAADRITLAAYARNAPPMQALPSPQNRLAHAQAASAQLVSMGYTRVGLNHFTFGQDKLVVAQANGRLRRNFQGYTADDAVSLVSFGAAAISKLPDGFVQSHDAVPAWHGCIAEGRLPVSRAVERTEDDRVREAVIESLMCQFHVDLRDISAQFLLTQADRDELLNAGHWAELAAMEADGLVRLELEGGQPVAVCVTEAGRPFVRNMCALFDAYLRYPAIRAAAPA